MYPNSADVLPLPPRPSLERYRKLAKDLAAACRSGHVDAIDAWAHRWVEALAALADSPEPLPNAPHTIAQLVEFADAHLHRESAKPCALTGAQFVVARAHGFSSWPKFAGHVTALCAIGSAPSAFERAADAIVAGDASTLRALLVERPGLVRARSAREHASTLLHYVGANGFENYRQKTPPNSVDIARMLLDAGADVDAVGKGSLAGSTALGLVATSVHPLLAGVQLELLDLLVGRGASVDGAPGGWNPLVAALHNGRGEAARFLADRGARTDLEGAAGAGRLDLVKACFGSDGALESGHSLKSLQLGFVWACEYGHDDVVSFLLDRGASLTDDAGTWLEGLHWAVVGRQLETVRLLLARGADVERINRYGGTALGTATWCAENHPGFDFTPIVELLLATGADVRRADYPTGRAAVDAALRRFGAGSDEPARA